MAATNLATFGIYRDAVTACEAVDELKRVGFRSTDTSVLLPENVGSKDMGHEKHTKAGEAGAWGALAGAILGGVFGWFVGAGTFGYAAWMAPFGAQPVGTMMSGIGAGSMLGLILGAILGSAVPIYQAKRYAGRLHNGGILVSVHCDNKDWAGRAKDVLRQTGARGIGILREAKADFGSSERPSLRTRAGTITPAVPTVRSTEVETSDMASSDKVVPDMVRTPRDQ